MIRSSIASLLLAVTLAAPSTAQVHLVRQQPLVFPTIQAAVDAALPGEILFVADGTYAGFVVDGKGLTILAWNPGKARVDGQVVLSNLPWKQSLLISGLRIQAQSHTEPSLEARDNLGHVRIESCTIPGGWWGTMACGSWVDGAPGVLVTNNRRIAFVRTWMSGADGSGSIFFTGCEGGWAGGPALRSIGSAVALYECTLTGGRGGDGFYAGKGGAGCEVTDLGLFASASTIQGGRGGDTYDWANWGGDGGDAVYVDVSAQAQLLDNTVIRGKPGSSCCNPFKTFGKAFAGAGILKHHGGEAKTLTAELLVVENETNHAGLFVQFADMGWVLQATKPAWMLPSPKNGIWLIPKTSMLPPPMVQGVSGLQTITLTAPSAGSAIARVNYLQGHTVQGPGQSTLGSPAHQVVLARTGPDCDGNGVSDYVDIFENPGLDLDNDLLLDSCE